MVGLRHETVSAADEGDLNVPENLREAYQSILSPSIE
jgi:hypothetical protein